MLLSPTASVHSRQFDLDFWRYYKQQLEMFPLELRINPTAIISSSAGDVGLII